MPSSSNLVNHQHQNARSKIILNKTMHIVKFGYFYILLAYFGIGCYLGQYLPVEWRRPLSITLFVIVLATLFIKRARKYGLIISHIYAIIIGLLSYATFSMYMQNLGADVL